MIMKRRTHALWRGIGGAALAAGLLASGTAAADNESCREWMRDHRDWKTETVRRYLKGASQASLDAAVFEVLQRESYLTSCDVPVRHGRDELVGWRLVGRTPDEYGAAVVESVLARAGFDLELRSVFARPQRVAEAPTRSGFRRGRSTR